jgi:toxin ParE1/3/4
VKLEYTSEALEDLAAIEIAGEQNYGALHTRNYLAKIEHSIGLIQENPMLAWERQDTLRPVRVHPVEAHLIIYEIIGNHIRIVRILYSRRNWREHI